MLVHCPTHILASVSPASVKVALSLPSLDLVGSHDRESLGCSILGHVLLAGCTTLAQSSTRETLSGPYRISCRLLAVPSKSVEPPAVVMQASRGENGDA